MNGKSQLCWDCQNAYADRCCWVGKRKAVKGWTAKKMPYKLQNLDCPVVETYFITACPNFVSDYKVTKKTEIAMKLAKEHNCSMRTIYKRGLMPKGDML